MKSILAGVVAALPVSTFVNLACAAGPRAVDKPGGRVFVSDSGNNLIQVLQGYGRQQHHQQIQLHLVGLVVTATATPSSAPPRPNDVR